MRLKDIDEVVEIWKRFIEQQRELGRDFGDDRMPLMKDSAPDFVRKYYNRTIRSKNGLLLVLEDNERLHGYMLSRIEKNIPVFKPDHIGHVVSIYLEEPYRGKGYSSTMFNMTLEWFKVKGIKEIIIEVFCYNPHAQKVYENWGFKNIHFMMRRELDWKKLSLDLEKKK